jgi:hypothetical protein
MRLQQIAVICALIQTVAATGTSDGDLALSREQQIVNGIDLAQAAREERLAKYSVTERYVLQNSHFSAPAEMTAIATYEKAMGREYRVVSRSGPAFLQVRVLDRILNEQAEMSRGLARKSALLNSANYRMKLFGEETLDGHVCDVMELMPRKKSTHVLSGKAWFDAESHHLRRIEGTQTASSSFWVGHPLILRDYEQIGDFTMAVRSRAHSQSFLLGRTDLTIEYSDYEIGTASSQ